MTEILFARNSKMRAFRRLHRDAIRISWELSNEAARDG